MTALHGDRAASVLARVRVLALDDDDCELALALLHVIEARTAPERSHDTVCWLSLLALLLDRARARTDTARRGVVVDPPTDEARAAIVRRLELAADVARLVPTGAVGEVSCVCSGDESDCTDGATCARGRHGVTASQPEVAR